MKKRLGAGTLMFFLFLISCHNSNDKKVAIDHLCKCILVLSSLQKHTKELGRVIHKNKAIVTNSNSQAQDILNAYDSLDAGLKTYKVHLDTVISELGAVKHIESSTQFQENSLRYLRDEFKVINIDFKAIYLAHKANTDQGDMDKYADLRKQIQTVSDTGDSLYVLQEKFAEEFKLSDTEIQSAMDCATK